MKKTRILAVAIFLVALSVIGYDAYAGYQGRTVNIDLKIAGFSTKIDEYKEYESSQKWESFGAFNSKGKKSSVLVNIINNDDETDWIEYKYIAPLSDPTENEFKDKWIKSKNKTFRAKIKTKSVAVTTYSTQNLWTISHD